MLYLTTAFTENHLMRAPFDRKTGEFISKPLIMSGCVARPADADEPLTGYEQSYDELKGDLLTLGWDNHQVYTIEYVDMNGNAERDDEEGHEPSDEVRGIFARFCAMNERQQTKFMYDLTMHICKLIGVSVTDWEPSDEFVLEAIEEELSDDEFQERALDAYLSRIQPDEDNQGRGLTFISCEEADRIHVGQQSTRGGLPNIGRRRMPSCDERRNDRRGPRRSWKSHCPKYGRQDYRHQQPRLEAKYDRRFARDEAHMEKFFSRISDYSAIEIEYDFLSVSDQMRIPDWEICGDHEVTQDDHREEFTADDVRLGRSIVPLSWYPSYSSARDDLWSGRGDFDHSFDDWMEELFDRFKGVGDRDDIFEGYGDADRDLDTATFSDSSRLRGTRKYNLRALTALHAVVA